VLAANFKSTEDFWCRSALHVDSPVGIAESKYPPLVHLAPGRPTYKSPTDRDPTGINTTARAESMLHIEGFLQIRLPIVAFCSYVTLRAGLQLLTPKAFGAGVVPLLETGSCLS